MKSKSPLSKTEIKCLVIADVIDLTDGKFEVTFESDDGGNHVQVAIEKHDDAQALIDHFIINKLGHRVLILKVPPGYLDL